MPSPIAAGATQSIAFDFTKAAPGAAPAATSFASRLLDARQNPAAKAAAHPHDSPAAAKRLARKRDDADDAAVEPTQAADRREPAKAEKPETERPVDEAREDEPVEEADDKHADEQTDGEAAQLAAMLAAAQQQLAAPVAADAEAAPTEENAASSDAAQAIAALATNAAAATAVKDALPADAEATDPNAKPAAPGEAAAQQKKPADKLDALTKHLDAVDGAAADVPVDARAVAAADRSTDQQNAGEQSADDSAMLASGADAGSTDKSEAGKRSAFDDLLSKLSPADAAANAMGAQPKPAEHTTTTPAQPALRPEQQFARDNVDRVVSHVQSQVNGAGNGEMRVRLDPPELGALDVAVKMLEGKMTASFTTSNDQATQLLSHSLNQLKSSLENAGITVDRIEVRQAAAPTSAGHDKDSAGQQQDGQNRGFGSASQQQGEQQRKQMVDRLWRKYAYGSDEVDLVA